MYQNSFNQLSVCLTNLNNSIETDSIKKIEFEIIKLLQKLILEINDDILKKNFLVFFNNDNISKFKEEYSKLSLILNKNNLKLKADQKEIEIIDWEKIFNEIYNLINILNLRISKKIKLEPTYQFDFLDFERYNEFDENIKEYIKLTHINCIILYLDYNFVLSKEVIDILIYSKRQLALLTELNSFSNKRSLLSLKGKIDLFLFKCKIRINDLKESKNNKIVYDVLFDIPDKLIATEQLHMSNFSKVSTYSEIHYNNLNLIDNNDDTLISECSVDSYLLINSNNLHRLTKLYKDKKNIKELSVIESNLKSFIINNKYIELLDKTNLDSNQLKFSILINLNYVYNNKLSLVLEENQNNKFSHLIYSDDKILENLFDFIDEKLKEIEDIQDIGSLKINNYFPYYKLYKYLIDFFEKNYRSINISKDINLFHKIVEDVFNKLIVNLNWCIENDFMHFCCLNQNLTDFHLYSGWVVPLSYKQIKLNIDELTKKYEVTTNKLTLIQGVNFQTKDFNSKLENERIKSIELIAIFTAVIAFVLGSSSILSGNKLDHHHAIKYMIILGIIQITFISIIWIIFDKDKFKYNKIKTVLMCLFMALSLFLFYHVLFT